MNAGRDGLSGEGGHLAEMMRAEAELLSSHDTHQAIADRLGISPGLVLIYCNHLLQQSRLERCTHVQHAGGKSEQPPPSDWFGRQDPRQGQGQPQYQPTQQSYRYPPTQQSYSQQSRPSSFSPNPHYAPPSDPPPYPGQRYQAQSSYLQRPYGEDSYRHGQPGPQSSYPGEQPAWAPSDRSARRSWPGRHKILTALAGFAAFWFIVAVTIVAASGGDGPVASTAAQAPETSPPAASSSPAAAPEAARTVATFSGSGQQNTPQFTVTATWKLDYSFNCASFGQVGNFQVYEDGGNDFSLSVNDLATSKGASTWAYSDAGSHYLQVNSECSWTMKVIDEP